MKKSAAISLAVTILFCILCTSFSSAPKKFKGTIKFFGNNPVEYPGLETEKGKLYTLEITEEADFSKEELLSHSGELIEISGYLEKDKSNGFKSLPDGNIIVTGYRLLAENKFPEAAFRELNSQAE